MKNSFEFLPNVSVIIPVYNGENDLNPLAECIKNQTYPKELVEYILINNNSQDQTKIMLQTIKENFKFQGIKIIILEENDIQSSYSARNKGIKASKGEIIAFTDADCRPEKNWLYNLIQPFNNDKIGIVAGEILALLGETLLEEYANKMEILSQKHTLANSFLPYGQTANLAIRKKIFFLIGIFRPYLTTGGDADICWRIQQQTNYQIYLAENAIVKHRHRSTLKEYQKQWQRYGKSNRYLHELHGVELMPELPLKDYLYILTRWVIKEVPINMIKVMLKKQSTIDIINTPLGLISTYWRWEGQKNAQISSQGYEIERLEE